MAQIYDLLAKMGRDEAKRAAPELARLIDIAADLLAEESETPAYVYSGFCLTALPHRALPADQDWERVAMSGRLRLRISPGKLTIAGKTHLYPVPCGAYGRLILLYLQTQAVKTGSPNVELGGSMHEWLGRMGVTAGGRTYKDIREQILRIMSCNLTFTWDTPGKGSHFERDSIIRGGFLPFYDTNDMRQGQLFSEQVTLSESFFSAIVSHPVPLLEAAIRQLSGNSLALDIYVWLAYRLHNIKAPTPITWQSVFLQFGGGYSEKSFRMFRKNFRDSIALALTVYPEARVDDNGIEGITLLPSHPPIAYKAKS